MLAPANIHPSTQKQELEPQIEPSISQPCQSQRVRSRDESKRIEKRLHQLCPTMSNHELYRFVPLKSAGYFTSCALKPLPQSTERIPDGPSPLIITANTPRTHQVTHFSDLWPAQSFRKWIKDCCHPFTACTQSYMKLHEAT